MTFPAVDLYPGPDLFPGSGLPIRVDGYQQSTVELALNGLVLTATDAQGCDWVAEVLTGWFGSPASTISPQARSRAPGSYPGPRQLAQRPVTVAGSLEAPSTAALEDAMDRLAEAASLDGSLMTVSMGDSTRSLIVYRQGEVTVSMLSPTTAIWSVQMVATEPRKFAAPLTRITALPSTTGGFGLPMRVPFGIPSIVVTGVCRMSSEGNYPGPVFLRIDGPCAGPVVTHKGSGKQLRFGESLVLAAGDWLDVDMENTSVLANGTSPRDGFITSRGWSNFEKGDNEWAFTAAVYNPAARLTVTAVPAWQS